MSDEEASNTEKGIYNCVKILIGGLIGVGCLILIPGIVLLSLWSTRAYSGKFEP